MDNYAVFGNPVSHSLSPRIQSMFADQTQQKLTYRKVLVGLNDFDSTVQTFFSNGGKGLNVTVPFKLQAHQIAGMLSGRAKSAGAVNTLTLQQDGLIYGDNTDGIGLVRDLTENLAWEIQGKRVLILGAGGAVRGVLGPLLQCHPRQIVIANRTVEKARQLAADFNSQANVNGCSYDALSGSRFDLIINASSAGLSGLQPNLSKTLLEEQCYCYDISYGPEPTPFMKWAAAAAAWAVSDGLGMLVEQGAEAFCIWRGLRPNTQRVIETLRAEFQ